MELSNTCPCPLLHQVPVAMLIADWDLRVIEGNSRFWEYVCGSEPAEPGTPLETAIPQELLRGIEDALARARETGEPTKVEGARLYTGGRPQQVLDLAIAPAKLGDVRVLMIASTAIPDSGRRVAELTLLQDMVRVLRQETELDRVLFATLTCATASGGMAFNRAFVLLIDPSGEWLQGRMALGPGSAEEAARIWSEISAHPRTLEEFAAAYDRWAQAEHQSLQDLVSKLRFSMQRDADQVPVLAAAKRRSIKVDDAAADERVSRELCERLGAREFVVAPMLVADEPCGVIIADNLYSGQLITHGDVRLLSLFAQHAGIAIESAQTYHEIKARGEELEQAYERLRETHEELVRAEKLAALGEMAARVAHDFRNPIVTIGGWARDLQEEPEDPDAVLRAATIIAEEADSLERILSMLVQPLASRQLRLQPTYLNQLISATVLAQEPVLVQRKVDVTMDLAADIPPVQGDPTQLRRAIINLMDNAANAMPDGGKLYVRTGRDDGEVWFQVADTGVGMSEEISSEIFNPFISTRHYGSGLGLAIVWDIVKSHGWEIEVDSQPGKGSVFTVRAPTGDSAERKRADKQVVSDH